MRVKNLTENRDFPSGHPALARLEGLHPNAICVDPCPGSSGVEQWIENPRVGGSIPPPGTTKSPIYLLILFIF